MILKSNVYKTGFIRRQSKMFKRDIRQKSHETRSIKYAIDIQLLIKSCTLGDNQKCVKQNFAGSHMKLGP